MSITWKEQLLPALVQQRGADEAARLASKYGEAFVSCYLDDSSIEVVLDDLQFIEKLSKKNTLELKFYSSFVEQLPQLSLRLFLWGKPIALSDILPLLDSFDLRTESESSYKVRFGNKELVSISDFIITYKKASTPLEEGKQLFKEAFSKVYFGEYECDGFNKLVLGASLSCQDIVILRAYTKYLLQIGFLFDQLSIEKTLSNHPLITKDLIAFFYRRFDPDKAMKREEEALSIEQRIKDALEKVPSLDDDRIIRRYVDLIKATVRTNFFQDKPNSPSLGSLSFKFSSSLIPDLPLPKPLYEIFVYSTEFEAIHLRKDKIARGGIRWSDRREDFRTEILGLMKAQVVKNSLIVPSGSKGGFVIKKQMINSSREAIQKEVILCYSSFIEALLNLTDTLLNKECIKPPRVVCYDAEDPYLVVAADKGTATFSDTANRIAQAHHFWLGDAFASGGSAGYDHKMMGITARGAWESIKRHFRELDCDLATQAITVVGIGDMSGDVFGNGLLYSQHLKLVGAFDHRHVFIDPTPNPEQSYQERLRLFQLPSSSWEDYDKALISEGGGVFKRSLKSILISPQMKKTLGISEDLLTPNELVCALLKAPVDLLYNGGIGTYVKSSQESAHEVGDRANDYCRVNGNDLRCKVVGEGGNLGFTQKGRIEFALNKGLINTDFIDNSGGVDCSDHEVNLKILLNHDVDQGRLTSENRNKLLSSLTDEVSALVLKDNYSQAMQMSVSAFFAKKNIVLHTDYINELEALGLLNRRVEFLPNEKELLERKAAGLGLTRPEMAVLFAYSKIHIKQEILKSNSPEDPYLNQIATTAFPSSIRVKYGQAILDHPLKRNLVATQLSNEVVNKMGMSFVYRIQRETGACVEEVIRAYTIASHSFGTDELHETIEKLDFKIPVSEQFEILSNIRNLINLATRWFIHENIEGSELEKTIQHYKSGIKTIERLIPVLMSGFTKQYTRSLSGKFKKAKLPKEIAQRIGTYRAIYTALNIIKVATQTRNDLENTAKIYFSIGEQMGLVWFRDRIANDTRDDHWNSLTRLTLRDELDRLQRALAVAVLKASESNQEASKRIDQWVKENTRTIKRWEQFLSMLHASSSIDYTMFFISLRELNGLLKKK